ncbi:MAG: bifunctional transaldolase/phosoglucose isomerase, partial [Deinococcus sp.]|nr:bifunctional transaldolase/phosoglucose isomerase [Deinococcus sp.]
MMNPLVQLQSQGQSVWLDYIRREILRSGELKKLIDEDGLLGVTSNPTIFEKAISGSNDYDDALKQLVREGHDTQEIYEALVIADIQAAADLFRPAYERLKGADGYVSIEVSPKLAHDTAGTISEARRLWKLISRPNILIKVPGTKEGVPAIEQLISEGINVNVTLLFSLASHRAVAEAYIAGLERRAHASQPLHHLASVASFFVSRVDTEVDKRLQALMQQTKDAAKSERLKSLTGKAAIANARLAYADVFKPLFTSARFQALAARGARVQRPLWASTSTKNPAYRDVRYAEELIGRDTVDTMPPATITAFRDHGRVRPSLEEDVAGARAHLQALAEVGISLDEVTNKLVVDGVKAFADSFDQLLQCIAARRATLRSGVLERQSAQLGAYQEPVNKALAAASEVARRVWEKDPTLWKKDEAHAKVIKNRLGWLTVGSAMLEHVAELMAFADGVRRDGFTRVVLLGMGGSSLAPEVLQRTFGTARGYPDLLVLDTTDPVSVRQVERSGDLAKTLFLVASKSGTTTEVSAFYQYFVEKVRALQGDHAGQNFAAITDPGTPLESLARAQHFRHIFLNPADIGGRYSALSYFGLVPAALLGIDLRGLLEHGERMAQSCASCLSPAQNPGVWLGTILGQGALAGRNKVTFITSRSLASLDYWLEQLIAESTGKEGKGIVPVEGEPLGDPAAYGADRVFVYLGLAAEADGDTNARLNALAGAGHPVVRLTLSDQLDLGAEFFRWEFATAVAGASLAVDPFDEPNVTESKDNTRRLLQELKERGQLPEGEPMVSEQGISLYGDTALRAKIEAAGARTLTSALGVFLAQARPGDYLALMAYIERSAPHERSLLAIRTRLRDALQVATTVGYGPRFLHSTGQLHKGGGANGLFLQITNNDATDLAIPGEFYSFGQLKRAQALGDLLSLQS